MTLIIINLLTNRNPIIYFPIPKKNDKGDYIYVHAFLNEKNEIIPYCKGHTDAGMRYLPLTKACKRILMEIKRINPDIEYLFIKNSRPLATVTFNRRIKKCCKELGIECRSSHKVQFSTASIMHKTGATDTELQEMLVIRLLP